MSQKITTETSRRDAILAAALPLFLENGYEKTSIRMVASKVGCEVGLVYYYFTTKEDIFEQAIALYFETQRSALDTISGKSNQDIALFLDTLFEYFEKEAPAFADAFRENVHWTVRCAIRTKFTELVKPHMETAVLSLASDGRMPYSAEFAVKSTTELIVHAALDNDKTYFVKHKEELHRTVSHILGTDKAQSRKKDIPSFLL